jgi:hypothetical protein
MINNNNNNQTVLATIKGEEAKRVIAALEAGDGFRFNAVKDENGNPVVELIKDD